MRISMASWRVLRLPLLARIAITSVADTATQAFPKAGPVLKFLDVSTFDGTSQCIGREEGLAADLPLGGAYTIEAEINPQNDVGSGGIVGWGSNMHETVNDFRMDGPSRLVHHWGAQGLVVNLSKSLADGQFHHVAVSSNGTVRKVYVDYVVVGKDSPEVNTEIHKSNFCIGQTNETNNFRGAIKNVKIWKHAHGQFQSVSSPNGNGSPGEDDGSGTLTSPPNGDGDGTPGDGDGYGNSYTITPGTTGASATGSANLGNVGRCTEPGMKYCDSNGCCTSDPAGTYCKEKNPMATQVCGDGYGGEGAGASGMSTSGMGAGGMMGGQGSMMGGLANCDGVCPKDLCNSPAQARKRECEACARCRDGGEGAGASGMSNSGMGASGMMGGQGGMMGGDLENCDSVCPKDLCYSPAQAQKKECQACARCHDMIDGTMSGGSMMGGSMMGDGDIYSGGGDGYSSTTSSPVGGGDSYTTARPDGGSQRSCDMIPEVLFAKDLSQCAGAPHGSLCNVQCRPGHGSPIGDTRCDDGMWQVSSSCQKSTNVVQVPAVLVAVRLEPGEDAQVDVVWARQHLDVLVEAVAGVLGVQAPRIMIDVQPLQASRRLQASGGVAGTWESHGEVVVVSVGTDGRSVEGLVKVGLGSTSTVQTSTGQTFTGLSTAQTFTGTLSGTSTVIWTGGDMTSTLESNGSLRNSDGRIWSRQAEERLQTAVSPYSASAFTIKVVVVADESRPDLSDMNAVRNRLEGSFAKSKTSSGGLLGALREAFLKRGMSAAARSLSKAAIAVERPRYFQGFTLPAGEWLVGEWGSCGPGCEESSQIRVTSCFSPGPGSCERNAGPAPPSQQVCQDHSECPFSAWCPLGPGADLDCVAQTACLVILVMAMCCCLAAVCYCIARRVRRKLKPMKQGSTFIKAIQSNVDFKVIRPPVQPQTNNSEFRPTLLEVKAPKGADGKTPPVTPKGVDERIHVVWNVDIEKVQCVFEEQRQLEDSPDFVDIEKVQCELEEQRQLEDSPDLARSLANGHDGVSVEQGIADCELGKETALYPAYDDSAKVEYFSSTNQQWTVGVVTVQILQDDFLLNVSINRGTQIRPGVALNLLRPMFQSGDLVEVLTDRDGGVFLPAVVAPDQSCAATCTGYQVDMLGTGERLVNTSPLLLRRRFPASSPVEMYRGQALGWCEARIHHEAASMDGCGAEGLNEADASETTLEACATARAAGFSDALTSVELDAPNQKPAIDACHIRNASGNISAVTVWTRIPLGTSAGPPEWVPSYLLRTRPAMKMAKNPPHSSGGTDI